MGPVAGIDGDEQDLSGFGVDDDERDRAIRSEMYLRRLAVAVALGERAGGEEHRPEVPWWALAENKIPDYYD